jgi:Phytanoyl-CoA dioxygenase (PhyH)
MWQQTIEQQGFVVIPPLLKTAETKILANALNRPTVSRSRAGVRHALGLREVASLARDSRLLSIGKEILGEGHSRITPPYSTNPLYPIGWWCGIRTRLFLSASERRLAGWGPWSVKEGVNYAQAPASALQQVLALRVHLDDSAEHNGPLRVLPETHVRGVLSDEEIERIVPETVLVECVVRKGGVLAMRPLVIHSSSKSQDDRPRRVLHIEYAASIFPAEGLELAIA